MLIMLFALSSVLPQFIIYHQLIRLFFHHIHLNFYSNYVFVSYYLHHPSDVSRFPVLQFSRSKKFPFFELDLNIVDQNWQIPGSYFCWIALISFQEVPLCFLYDSKREHILSIRPASCVEVLHQMNQQPVSFLSYNVGVSIHSSEICILTR